ncbi:MULTISPECIES: peptidoglycan-binding domain-containing protein [Blautia]|uniref:Peptidoglycan-binding protein n=1 Tax=Blautia celeris TaxID=2763026 RepID=A0ABR7FC24_9FIRM|nr:peptidoglycan-binding protein [Blautia celeris]RHP73602.1 peptidoglycan-binding protein [Blautia sp. OF01-4LB]RHS21443.1 peptidoglycan-binding protein [Blautia sp. AF13-16]
MEAVVLQYQRDHRLTVDGIAGHDTFMVLIAK